MIQILCDGCGRVVGKPTLEAQRTDGNDGGSPLPSQAKPLQWCVNCALIATAAVDQLRSLSAGAMRENAAYRSARTVNAHVALSPGALS